jgi:signal transduction histidine kinase
MLIKTLRSKVLVYFVLTAAAITGVFGIFIYFMIMQDLDREMESRLFVAGNLIKETINPQDLKYFELKGKIYGDYRKKLSDLKDTAEINNIIVINKGRKVILSLAPEGGDFFINLDSFEISKALKGVPASSPLYRGAMGKYYKTGYLPVQNNGLTEAVIGVEAGVLYLQYINHYRFSIFLAGIIILVVAFIVSLFITSGITGSIRRLKLKAEAIARRDFNEKTEVGGEEEIKALAGTLDNMKKELKEYIENREKMATVGEFSAGVAHEIRNSLGSLSGYAELILEKTKDEKVREYAADIVKNAMKMSGFLNNFLAYTKEFTPDMQAVKVSKVVDDAVADLPGAVRAVIKRDYNDFDAEIPVDAFLIKKALYNIIINAYQALDKAEKRIEIGVSKSESEGEKNSESKSESKKNRVQITIKDNGKGMPENIKSKIFQPFFTGRKEGTGLGLAISYRIIKEIHGGEIIINSIEGEGTEVVIELS